VGTATDIEDQKQLEGDLLQAQREASRRLAVLEALYSSAPIGFGLVDHNARVLRMNEQLAAFNGAPIADQLGRTLAELVPELWPQLEPALTQARETDEAVVNLQVVPPSSVHSGPMNGWLSSCYPVRRDGAVIGFGFVIVIVGG
jgi:PAS domain-containing protein